MTFRRQSNFPSGLWPVLQRELRVTARRPFNYWLRVLSALSGTLVIWANLAGSNMRASEIGPVLFIFLHFLLLGMLLLIVPALAADVIAREKREGTLGLLFLTPLTAMQIVVGKELVQILRAFTLWLAVLPVLSIPILAGGVGIGEVLRALATELCVALLCLCGGVLASSLAKTRGVAFLFGIVLAAGFVFLFGRAVLCLLQGQLTVVPRVYSSGLRWLLNDGVLFLDQQTLGNLVGRPRYPTQFWVSTLGASLLAVLLLVFACLRFAAKRIERSWHDKIPSTTQTNLVRRYCTPLFQHRFSRKMRRQLDRNPVAWLQQYSWKARLVKWGLCLAFLGTAVLLPTSSYMDSDARDLTRSFMFYALAAAMTYSGINSFLEEKRSGALELILITPIPVNQIIVGRVWGLWKQFLPAALMLAGWDAGCLWISGDLRIHFRPGGLPLLRFEDVDLAMRAVTANGFFALPFCATYFALRLKNLIAASVLAWVALLIAPCFAAALNASMSGDDTSFILLLVPCNLALALLVSFLLRHSLSRRLYSF